MPVLTRSAPKLNLDPAKLPGDLFIGGAWRPGATGKRIDVVDPSTGSVFASVADASAEDALDAVARGARGLARLGRHRAAQALGDPAPLLRADARAPGHAGRAHLPRERQGARRRGGRGHLCRRVLPLVLRGGGAAERRARRRTRRRQPDPRRAPADRGRGHGDAVELPRRHGDAQDRARPRRRLHLRPEAGHRDPLHRLRPRRPLRRGGGAGRRRQRADHLALGRHGQRHAARPARPQALLHRLDRGRPHPPQGGRRPGAELLHGARRQRALRRLRRRRPRGGARRGDDRQDAQRRRGLHRGQPVHRAGAASSPPSPRASPPAWPPSPSGRATTPPRSAAR